MQWTKEQQQVIEVRDRNVLVSAAAGSGKTAVLVARILSLVTDREHPVDIDRLLIVTFTNAAASEMRQRIRDAIEDLAEEQPDNVHLQKQLVLIHNAKITTIHSFCLHVLRNHFHTIGLDPSFRVADEGEVMLIRQEALKEVLEEAYDTREEHPEFSEFLENYATGRDDRQVEESILALYHFSLGQPWPKLWLAQCRKLYERSDQAPDWLEPVVFDTKQVLNDALSQLSEALELAEDPDGPYPYIAAIEDDIRKLEMIFHAEDYFSLAEAFSNAGTYARLSPKKDPSISDEKKQQVKEIREQVKKDIAEIRKQYFYDLPEVLLEEFYQSGVTVRELTRLAELFSDRLSEKKAEKNLLDFSDLEHLALQILVEREDGNMHPSAAAREYAEQFEEIMIDEYQDSNLVQELILNSVAGNRGMDNLFMVGDVKQSIYRFRLARPELFMEKYHSYDGEDSTSCRIDLHKNFRSRTQVLNSVNYIFRQIMTEHPGGIRYDEEAALYTGAAFPENTEAEPDMYDTELLLIEYETEEKKEMEAKLAGERIRSLVGVMPVWDAKLVSPETGEVTGGYRPAEYRDIVILLRTVNGWADVFADVLGDMGIPTFTGSQTGYFSAVEVRTVLSYLEVLDNPIQDIPLAAVLRSPVGKLEDWELAEIRSSSDARLFYDACREYQEKGTNPVIRKKLEAFFEMTNVFRRKAAYTPIHLLLWEIFEQTGYRDYVTALPGGTQRRANLDMLIEKAVAYEAASYRGLYHFIRYIENLKRYEIDFGEANTGAEGDNTVRIMSIHKSKGLEFPIVFLCGTAKKFNETDIRSKLAMHPELGIACDYVDTEQRLRAPNLLKKVIQNVITSENLGEELRVLYVAMTRAKEKLIITGALSEPSDQMEKWCRTASAPSVELPYARRMSASCYLDWIMPALLRHPDSHPMLFSAGLYDFPDPENHEMEEGIFAASWRMELSHEKDLEWLEQNAAEGIRENLEKLRALNPEKDGNAAAAGYLDHVFSFEYAYAADQKIRVKMTVSELKKRSFESEEEAEVLYAPEEVVPLLPEFMSDGEKIRGAARGSLYHLFMENYDFGRKTNPVTQLEELVSSGKITGEEASSIRIDEIRRFLDSGIGKRMAEAAEQGRLHREQPFVLGVPADTIHPEWSSAETVLIQGIIDAWFVEGDAVVVVDYKTDRIGSMKTLEQRYRLQLDYYASALECLTGYEVRERVIYSFCLGKETKL